MLVAFWHWPSLLHHLQCPKRIECVLWTGNPFPEKQVTSCYLAGSICVCRHPRKDTLGTDEDIWRYSTCHICWRPNTFASTLSLPRELPCIPGMMLWSAQLPVSQLGKPASTHHSQLQRQRKAVDTAARGACYQRHRDTQAVHMCRAPLSNLK